MTPLEGPEELSPELRVDLADWLLALADNKELLGLRYAEWCTGAPELEADIAVTAMAQYELGHARLLDGVLGDLPEDPRGDDRDEEASAWRSLPYFDRPFSTWQDLVVANALIDPLLTLNLEAAAEGGYRPLAQRLRKAVAEERFHTVHGRAWLRKVIDGPRGTAAGLQEAVEAAWPQCLAFFGPVDDDNDNALDRLAAAGVLAWPAGAMRRRYLETVTSLTEGSSLELPVRRQEDGWRPDSEPDWSGWSEARRRHGEASFDRAALETLTGAHARAMGVTD